MGHDVIIVGARIAGSATALLLARAGVRVLVVDRAAFPSDTLSTHQVQVPGVARLARWGLLDSLVAAGTPATRQVTFRRGDTVISGRFPAAEGADAMYSPRRTLLDALLVEAAREAGADVRESTIVEDLLTDDGAVTGIRCHAKGGGRYDESAALVVGADGKNSLVARTVGARTVHQASARSIATYAYWDGLELPTGEMHSSDRRVVGAWPTNDGLVITYAAWPASELPTFRRNPEQSLLATLDGAGSLGERARSARRAGPVRATTDLPNAVRAAYGPGWALVGDAGLVMDPITGQGIGHALRDAELLAGAVVDSLAGRRSLRAGLARYQRARDRQTRPMFDFTVGLASFLPSTRAEQRLFDAIAARPADSDGFFSVLAGVTPMASYFSPAHLVKLVGLRGFLALGRARQRHPAPRPAVDDLPAEEAVAS